MALVAAILAVVMERPLLFVAAGLSLVVSVVLMVIRVQRRRSGYKQTVPSTPDAEGSDDLASLGILEIRPRQKGGSEVDGERAGREISIDEAPPDGPGRQPDEAGDVETSLASSDSKEAGRAAKNGARERSPVQSTITIKEREQIVRASVDESAPAHFRDVLVPYLQAFRAAVGANTVCLLKQPDESSHYHIEAIVSLNAYARSSGTFSSKQQLLERHDVRSAPEVTRASDGNLSSHALGYYRESIAVKEFATAAVPRPTSTARYILLADAMREHTLDSDRTLSLISYFARLLGAVLDKGGSEDVLDDGEEYVRPRREIIGEEIRRARRDEVPLALALVYLNNAETIADLGEREIAGTERQLADRLRESAGKARVERFGELTFGAFFKEAGPYVERWAVGFQNGLEDAEGKLAGGVSIGIALLDERHADADSFRRDATDALREAYESGTCTIVE
ncbi:MAG: hypothetical protein WD021_07645 [Rhodothermales bacterium]